MRWPTIKVTSYGSPDLGLFKWGWQFKIFIPLPQWLKFLSNTPKDGY